MSRINEAFYSGFSKGELVEKAVMLHEQNKKLHEGVLILKGFLATQEDPYTWIEEMKLTIETYLEELKG